MSKKQIAILIIAVAVAVAAASVGTAYVVVTGNSELALDGAGDEFTASARIDGLLPGQSSTSEYKAHAPADAVFTILLSSVPITPRHGSSWQNRCSMTAA